MNYSDSNFDTADPFLVTAPREIIAILRSIEKKKPLIRMHGKDNRTAFVTTVLELDTDNNALIIDSTPDAELNARLVALPHIFFETTLEKIHVKFSATEIKACLQDNLPALCMAIPTELSRIQRRDFFRINTPVVNPVLCVVPLPKGSNPAAISLPLEDISCGGIAIFDDNQTLDHKKHTIYKGCTIELPDVGAVTVDLKLAHAEQQNLANDKVRYRLGCSFLAPSGATLTTIQRYVTKLERELIAKQRGF